MTDCFTCYRLYCQTNGVELVYFAGGAVFGIIITIFIIILGRRKNNATSDKQG